MDTTKIGGHPVTTKEHRAINEGVVTVFNDEPEAPARKSELVEIPTPTARVLYKATAIFPLDLFPNEIIIDEIKVSIIYKGLIHRQFSNILIKDITDILYNGIFFLGSLGITGGEYQSAKTPDEIAYGPLTITTLWKEDAQMARRVILGLMIFSDQKVDTSKMTVSEIIEKTSELGRARA